MRTIFFCLIGIILITNIKAQLDFKNICVSGNIANVYHYSKQKYLNSINYNPNLGIGIGLDLSHSRSGKFVYKFPVSIELNRVSNYGLVVPLYIYNDHIDKTTIEKLNFSTGVVPNYCLNKNIEVGLGPIINYNLYSQVRLSEHAYEVLVNYQVFEDPKKTYPLNELCNFKLGYLFNVEFKYFKNTTIFIRIKQCFNIKDNDKISINEYETALSVGCKFGFKKKDNVDNN